MSTTLVGLRAQMSALIHGMIAMNPAHPMRLTGSASGCLRAIGNPAG